MFNVIKNNGSTVKCADWDAVCQAIDIYVPSNEKVSAKALFAAGNTHYAFVYGFSAVHVEVAA